MFLILVPTPIFHWLSQEWVECLMVPRIYLLSLGCMPSLLPCPVMLGLGTGNSVSQAPLPFGSLPTGGTGANQQVAGRERMLCLISVILALFPLSSSDNDSERIFTPSSTTPVGVAVTPLFS